MIPNRELKKIAVARIKDAEVLSSGGRYDGAVYLCGYAVEVTLKARICRTLKWQGFPSTNREFEGLQSLRTHRLDLLLSLSGQDAKIKTRFLADWSIVISWEPETRYSVIGTVTKSDAQTMIASAKIIVNALK